MPAAPTDPELEEWQLAEIRAGLDAADRGEFASDEEVASIFAKYIKPTDN
jgi:predicted transcriptional regulator